MPLTADPSLQALKLETEQTRAGLTETVEQLRTSISETASELRHRASPEAIKAEVTDYVRSRGERIFEDMKASAKRNPMQAVAIGASVAYPLLKLARAIPLPVILVGAGFFFAGTNAGRSATQKASDIASEYSDELNRRKHDLTDQLGASIDAAKDFASDAVSRAGDLIATGAAEMRQSTSSTAASLPGRLGAEGGSIASSTKTRTGGLKDEIAEVATSATEAIQAFSMDMAASARSAATAAANAAQEAATDLRNKGLSVSGRSGKTILDAIEHNPLLVAGVGLFLGGLIASALPRTDLEQGVVGEASASAKRRAQEVASQGYEAVKGAAGEIIENVTRQAGIEGLTPDNLGTTAKDIGERVRRVAESAVTTAFDPENDPNVGKGNDHG